MRACNWGGNQSQMREAIRGVHARLQLGRQSVTNEGGHQRQSEAIRGNQRRACSSRRRKISTIRGAFASPALVTKAR